MLCVAWVGEQCGSSLSECGKVWSSWLQWYTVVGFLCYIGMSLLITLGLLMSWCRLGPNQC